MRQIMLVIIAFVFIGCENHSPQLVIGKDFQPYVARFEQDAASVGKPTVINDLIVQWGDLGAEPIDGLGSPERLGLCHRESNKTPVITINSNPDSGMDWQAASDIFKETLVYHELGHCVLGLSHDLDMWQTPTQGLIISDSIMYPGGPNLDFYIPYREHFIQQLFAIKP